MSVIEIRQAFLEKFHFRVRISRKSKRIRIPLYVSIKTLKNRIHVICDLMAILKEIHGTSVI